MTRWLASRWMVIGMVLSVGAFALSWTMQDTSAFTAVATAYLAMGGASNVADKWRDVRREQMGGLYAPRADTEVW